MWVAAKMKSVKQLREQWKGFVKNSAQEDACEEAKARGSGGQKKAHSDRNAQVIQGNVKDRGENLQASRKYRPAGEEIRLGGTKDLAHEKKKARTPSGGGGGDNARGTCTEKTIGAKKKERRHRDDKAEQKRGMSVRRTVVKGEWEVEGQDLNRLKTGGAILVDAGKGYQGAELGSEDRGGLCGEQEGERTKEVSWVM